MKEAIAVMIEVVIEVMVEVVVVPKTDEVAVVIQAAKATRSVFSIAIIMNLAMVAEERKEADEMESAGEEVDKEVPNENEEVHEEIKEEVQEVVRRRMIGSRLT
jgi:hypothetical protein